MPTLRDDTIEAMIYTKKGSPRLWNPQQESGIKDQEQYGAGSGRCGLFDATLGSHSHATKDHDQQEVLMLSKGV